MTPSPAFWQAFLAAEIPSLRAHKILGELEGTRIEPLSWLQTRAPLTGAERERVLAVRYERLEKALANGVSVVAGPMLPNLVADSKTPPPALFVWGQAEVLHEPCFAIVGTRSATAYGRAAAMKFAERLAKRGITIVSGGAYGIDAAAHKGVLGAGGRTVAVLGTGVDDVYPASHRSLFQQIRESGCLVSQFAVGAKIMPARFSMRNHLIAALSLGVLVVEAPEKSGALGTAGLANELGRPVFVVPANIDNGNFRGSHALIRDGAILVDHPDQILEALGFPIDGRSEPAAELDERQSQIVETLAEGALSPEALSSRTGLSPEAILSELTVLELEGIVFQDAGRYLLRP
ncbi:MAG TPA: DNA-processing protein DprA [Fimbriimonadaceae bacterium]|nr:DNA-processing protein DprA [Fimbriimonadaceae bacterium]HRJ96798.1 DNA-processing protein DprA [Fimbriimonadaceae bacterium]